MKKTFIKKLAVGLIAAATLFTNISCGNMFTNDSQTAVDTNVEKKVTVKPYITDVSRSVFPDIKEQDLRNISLSYTSSTTSMTNILAVYDDVNAFNKAKYSLEPGFYSFKLTAMSGGVYLSAEIAETEYKASAEEVPLNFELKYKLADAIKDGSGNAYFYFEYSKDKKMTDAIIKFYKYDENGNLIKDTYNEKYYSEPKSKVDGTNYIDYSLDDVPAGIYEIQFEIKAEDEDENGIVSYSTASYKNSVYIANGCKTNDSYVIKDGYWANKYVIGSAVYSDKTDHMKAEVKEDGIYITISDDDEWDYTSMDIVEEETKVGIQLDNWYYNEDGTINANCVPRKYTTSDGKEIETISETTVVYPFVKADQKYYIFTLTRWVDSDDNPDGKSFWDDSEKIIVDASAVTNVVKVLEDDYANKMKRMSVDLRSEEFVATLKYDWRKLFDKIDSTVFEEFKVEGTVYAGDKTWGDNTTNCVKDADGNRTYHEWFADMNLLTKDGMDNYVQFLNGIEYHDVVGIKNCKEFGQYWINTSCSFKLNNPKYKNLYHTATVESDVKTVPNVEMVTITFVDKPNESPKKKAYKKGSWVDLPSYGSNDWWEKVFTGWYNSADYSGETVTTFECTEETTYYAKWNVLINDYKGVNNYHSNIPFNVFGVNNEDLIKDNKILIKFTGKAASDYSGAIHAELVDYTDHDGDPSNDYQLLSWRNPLSGYTFTYNTGDSIEWIFSFDSHQFDKTVNFAALEIKGICLYTENASFEISDWSVSVIEREEYVLTANKYHNTEYNNTECNYQTVIPLTQFGINELVSTGDKISVSVDGIAKENSKYLYCFIVSNDEADNKGWKAISDNHFHICWGDVEPGQEISENHDFVITQPFNTTNPENICLVIVTHLTDDETIDNHRESVTLPANIVMSLDTTGRYTPVTDFSEYDEYIIPGNNFVYNGTPAAKYELNKTIASIGINELLYKGDKVKISVEGAAKENINNLRFRVVSRAPEDGYWKILGVEDVTGICGKKYNGQEFSGEFEYPIAYTSTTDDLSKLYFQIMSDLLDSETVETHKESVTVPMKITCTLDKSERVEPVTISFVEIKNDTYEVTSKSLYPGKQLECPENSSSVFVGWFNVRNESVTVVPETDTTLFAHWVDELYMAENHVALKPDEKGIKITMTWRAGDGAYSNDGSTESYWNPYQGFEFDNGLRIDLGTDGIPTEENPIKVIYYPFTEENKYYTVKYGSESAKIIAGGGWGDPDLTQYNNITITLADDGDKRLAKVSATEEQIMSVVQPYTSKIKEAKAVITWCYHEDNGADYVWIINTDTYLYKDSATVDVTGNVATLNNGIDVLNLNSYRSTAEINTDLKKHETYRANFDINLILDSSIYGKCTYVTPGINSGAFPYNPVVIE